MATSCLKSTVCRSYLCTLSDHQPHARNMDDIDHEPFVICHGCAEGDQSRGDADVCLTSIQHHWTSWSTRCTCTQGRQACHSTNQCGGSRRLQQNKAGTNLCTPSELRADLSIMIKRKNAQQLQVCGCLIGGTGEHIDQVLLEFIAAAQ